VRALLRLYPRRWRERYGDEYEAVLEAAPAGPGTVLDVLRGAVEAHAREMRPGEMARCALLALCTLVAGWLNVHTTDDVQPVAAALLVFGFGLGAHRPSRAWAYALLLAAAVPLSGAWDVLARHQGTSGAVQVLESVIALVPALLGAYAGAVAGWTVRRVRV
jgi:hypothetical protein